MDTPRLRRVTPFDPQFELDHVLGVDPDLATSITYSFGSAIQFAEFLVVGRIGWRLIKKLDVH
jgi:hypothetical protein